MKKHRTGRVILPIAKLTATLALAITLTFTACEEKGGGGKLLETITDESGTRKFEYDKQNRIVKIGDKTITYADNLITVGTEKYVINGNTVTYDNGSFTIDKEGYIVKDKFNDGAEGEHNYKDGNLIKVSWNYGDVNSYSYDDKKSPFSNCTTPKWLIQHLLNKAYASKNNAVDDGDGREDHTFKYEYDGDGFPVKATVTAKYYEGCEENCEKTTTTRYTYRGEPQNAKATEAEATEPASDKRIPAGYKLIEQVNGDLNGDGTDDCVLIIEPTNGESYIGFMIFFNDGSNYKLILENKRCFYTEFRWPSKFYIKKGNLYFYFESSGTCNRYTYTYTFKYRNSEFELIGYDALEEDCGDWDENHSRVGGSISKTSTNFITKKKQTILNGKETWSKITVEDPILLRKVVNWDDIGSLINGEKAPN